MQALVLLNDTQFVEAARVMAQRLVADFPQDPACRFETAFRLATSRMPKRTAVEVLLAAYEEQLAHFQAMPEQVGRLILTGEYPVDDDLSAPDIAATTMVTSLLLNLGESMTKR